MALLPLMLSLGLAGPAPSSPLAMLEARGLSRREATSIDSRHRRRHGKPVSAELVERVLHSLDALDLLPGHIVHLLRSNRLDELVMDCERAVDRPRHWCSFKKTLCDCDALPPPTDEVESVPAQLLAVDCEFRPLRVAAVDEHLRLRFDLIVPDEHAFPMLPGVLSCDRPLIRRASTAETRELLLQHLDKGASIVGHTIRHDLDALGMSAECVADIHVVDIALAQDAVTDATLNAEVQPKENPALQKGGGKAARQARKQVHRGEQALSLRKMAEQQLGVEIHQGGRRHCAIQDAEVAMRIYLLNHPQSR